MKVDYVSQKTKRKGNDSHENEHPLRQKLFSLIFPTIYSLFDLEDILKIHKLLP